ncbi:hypothetical protein Tco_1349015, partial [Tanacetum coccineum]
IEDSDLVQEEIDLFPGPDDLIPPGVENDDSEDEDNSTFFPANESSILDPSSPRPPPEPPDVCLNFEPNTAMKNDFVKLNEDFNQGMDIAKIARKQSKPDKHGHGNGRAHKELGVSTKRGNSNWQRGLVIRGLSKDMAQGNVIKGFHCTKGHITDCHTGNPCAHQNNPRAKNRDPMIGKIQGQGFMGTSNKLQDLEASLKAI